VAGIKSLNIFREMPLSSYRVPARRYGRATHALTSWTPDRRRMRILFSVIGLLIMTTVMSCQALAAQPTGARPYRILHIMSFDSPWRWTDGQFAGFKEGLGNVAAEYRVFQMDVKRNSSREAKEQKGREARALVDSWKPDLVYTSDDDAQDFVTRHYVGKALPFVFSGVNKSLSDHGIEGAANVTGVLEQEHFVESVKLLQAIVPKATRLAVISDGGAHWGPVIERIRAAMSRLPGTRLVAVDQVQTFDEFKSRLTGYAGQADAVVYLGIFALAGAGGANVPYQEAQRWVCENVRLPDISFWVDRVHYGVLASVTVSEHEQGYAAGRLARSILVDGASPAGLAIKPTVIGHPAINLARARQLGIKVKSTQLLSSEVVTEFEWRKSK
jgi:ABC-type uncharacterized transport system substrate-binding protein